MIYVPKTNEAAARRLVNFDGVGNIDKSGSVVGMRRRFGWLQNGQVRLGRYIYNIGPDAVKRLRAANLLRGYK